MAVDRLQDTMSAVKFKDQSENLQLPMSTIMRGRECLQFSKASGDICDCGADKSHHSDLALRNENVDVKWRLETHTRIKRRSGVKGGTLEYFSHGNLKFRNDQASSSNHRQIVIKYATIYPDSDLRCLLQFMVDEWKLEPPRSVLSLEGDTENLSQADVTSIKYAARDTGAWIIKEGHTDLKQGVRWECNGTDAPPVIGISPFPVDELRRTVYFTRYHPAFKHESNSELVPAVEFNYQVIGDMSDVRQSYLKTCHTHFLLVSNGNIQQEQDQTDGPRLIYQNLLGALSKLVPSSSHMTIPVLNLIAGCSPRLNELINRASCSNDHPVLCIQPGHNSRQEGNGADSSRSEIDTAISHNAPHDVIFTYSVLQESDIIRSVLSRVPPVDRFYMAQIWNNNSLAEAIIEAHSTLDNTKSYSKSMDHALLHGQVGIVEILLKNNFRLSSYLTPTKLTLLYNKLTASPITGILKSVAFKKRKDENITLDDVGDAVFELTMGTYKSVFTYHRHIGSAHSSTRQSPIAMEELDNSTHSTKPNPHTWLNPIHELFILFILYNQSDMAMFFWKHLRERISGALIGSLVLKQLAGLEVDTEHKKTLKELSSTYCHLAEDLINACFCEDKCETASLLTGADLYPWGTTTCLHVIVMLQEPTLTTQPGVQHVTQDIWTGQIADKDTTPAWKVSVRDLHQDTNNLRTRYDLSTPSLPHWITLSIIIRLCLCLLCPLLSHWLLTFMDEEKARSYESITPKVCLHFIDQDEQVTPPTQTSLSVQRSCCAAVLCDCLKFVKSPYIKYCYSMISNVIFLLLYSYIILCDFTMDTSPAEIFLIIWVGALYMKEFMQIQSGWSISWQHRFRVWFSKGWNQVDLMTFTAFTVAVTLKLTSYSTGAARVILAVNLMVLYMRLCLQFFKAHKHAGPLLSMIRHMLTDLSYFLGILFVFLLGYGVATQAILFPNTTDPAELMSGVFKRAYFHMFGELFLEEIHYGSMDCSRNETEMSEGITRCPEYSWVGVVLLAIYMMISNVLLLNILIAMFSNTFNSVEEHSSVYWKIQEYDLVMEYIKRPILPPPFNILYLPYTIVNTLIEVCKGKKEKKFDLKSFQRPTEPTDQNRFEEAVFHKYAADSRRKTAQDITLQDLNMRLVEMSQKVDHLLILADQ